MAKYKVGDKVRIVSEMPCDSDFALDMRRFLGKEITISMAKEWDGVPHYYSEDAKPKSLIAEGLFAVLGVPGYYFRENWISGLAEPEKPADENLSVTIRFCGRMTVAELYKNGKVVKVENARCNPKDEYSRAEGARIAVERLFRKNVASSKNKVRSDEDIASGIAAGVCEASEPKVGDKFIVVGNCRSPLHYFNIGEIVTLAHFHSATSCEYKNKYGKRQVVNNLDVKPYKENAK